MFEKRWFAGFFNVRLSSWTQQLVLPAPIAGVVKLFVSWTDRLMVSSRTACEVGYLLILALLPEPHDHWATWLSGCRLLPGGTMLDLTTFGVFFAAAFVLAIVPGPGMLYVLARTVRGGRREGLLSTLGTALAGMLHTLAAALGISAVLATSAVAFSLVKWAGVLYLIYLGLRTLFERGEAQDLPLGPVSRGALRQGVLTEALNPKTALFFLAFIPQFIDPNGNAFAQFVLLGFITTFLTSGADLLVVLAAGPLSRVLRRSQRLQRVQRVASGGTLVGLGVFVAGREYRAYCTLGCGLQEPRQPEAPPDDVPLVPQPLHRPAILHAQVAGHATTHVHQLHQLQVLPDPFFRVQIRRIPRQPLQPHAPLRLLLQVLFHDLAAVRRQAIPDHQHPPQVPHQVPQEAHRVLAFDRVWQRPMEDPPVRRDATHQRQVITSQGRVQDRRVATRRVGSDDARQQVEGCLVDEHDGPTLGFGFF